MPCRCICWVRAARPRLVVWTSHWRFADKLAGRSTGSLANRGPDTPACAAWIEGEIFASHDVGDHVAFLLSPVSGGAGPEHGELTLAQTRDIEAGHPA